MSNLGLASIDLAGGRAAAGPTAVDTWAAPLALFEVEGVKRQRLSGWGSDWESCGHGNK